MLNMSEWKDYCSSPELAKLSPLNVFRQLQGSSSVTRILQCIRIIANKAEVNGPRPLKDYYPSVNNLLNSIWPAKHWLESIDAKLATPFCKNGIPSYYKVLVVGGGPCGLRTAIEAQLLGATVTVVEKRDWFSRNNALYLWPFVVKDLKSLGIKTFSKGFGTREINLISVRQLQHSLLKIALLLAIEFHPRVEVKGITEPQDDGTGWRVDVLPANHLVSKVDFHAIIGACGKPSDLNMKSMENTMHTSDAYPLNGFCWRCINPKAKRAIGITANFIRDRKYLPQNSRQDQTQKKDSNDLLHLRNVETHFYYPCDTHYLIMCVSVECLLRHRILLQAKPASSRILSKNNVDNGKLKEFAKDFAKLVINNIGELHFATDAYNNEDLAIFDFTWSWRAEPSCRIIERNGKTLFLALVGDSLIDPYWPSGSGTAKGFMSALDTCWIMRQMFFKAELLNPIQLLAEKEVLYGQLKKIHKPEHVRLSNEYTIDPISRYLDQSFRPTVNCLLNSTNFYTSDVDHVTKGTWTCNNVAAIHSVQVNAGNRQVVLNWCNERLHLYGIMVNDLSNSWTDGFALCGILHSLSPDIIQFESLSDTDGALNNQLALNIFAILGIQPAISGHQLSSDEMEKYESQFLSYLLQVISFIGEKRNLPSYLWKGTNTQIAEMKATSNLATSQLAMVQKPEMAINKKLLLPFPSPFTPIPEIIFTEYNSSSGTQGTEITQTEVPRKNAEGNIQACPAFDSLHAAQPQSVIEDMIIPKINHHSMTPTQEIVDEITNKQNVIMELPQTPKILWRSTSEPLLLHMDCSLSTCTCGKSTDFKRMNLAIAAREIVDMFCTKCHYCNTQMNESKSVNCSYCINLKKRWQECECQANYEKSQKELLDVKSGENCCFCKMRVYPLERICANSRIFHKYCLQCEVCHIRLQLNNFLIGDKNAFLCSAHCTSITASCKKVKEAKIMVQNVPTSAFNLGWCNPVRRSRSALSKIAKLKQKIKQHITKVSTPCNPDLVVTYDAYLSSDEEDKPETLGECEWSRINFGIVK